MSDVAVIRVDSLLPLQRCHRLRSDEVPPCPLDTVVPWLSAEGHKVYDQGHLRWRFDKTDKLHRFIRYGKHRRNGMPVIREVYERD